MFILYKQYSATHAIDKQKSRGKIKIQKYARYRANSLCLYYYSRQMLIIIRKKIQVATTVGTDKEKMYICVSKTILPVYNAEINVMVLFF